jgi:arylsulfatase A-like enzyme
MRTPTVLPIFLCLLLGALLPASQGADTPRPNILIAIADDWSFGHAGAYNCPWVKTPGFDRVAKEGVLFNRFYTPSAKCSPSRSAILTGRNPWQLGAAANHWPTFPPEFRTYPETLAAQGYFIGMTMKGWGPGEAKDANGKPRQMAGVPFNKRTAEPPTPEIAKNDYAANFNDFLNANTDSKPWCFWYGCVEPHRAYEYGSGVAKGGKKLSDIDRVPSYWPDNEAVRNDMLDYAFEVEHFDKHLQRMLQDLENRGQLDNTIVMVMADNGMPFPRSKGQNYEIANHLPLAIRWPAGIPAPGRIIDDYVSVIDLAPTLLEATGVAWKESGMAPMTGRSILPLLRSDRSGILDTSRDHVLLGRERNDVGRPNDEGYPIRSIIKNGLLYSRNYEPSRWPGCNPETGYLDCDSSPTKSEILHAHRKNVADPFWALAFGKRGEEELYDLNADPDCVKNIVASQDVKTLKTALLTQMEAELLTQEDPRMLGRGAEFDAYPFANDIFRGFYKRFSAGAPPLKNFNKDDFETDILEVPTNKQ